jgi:hypothetical protein
MDAIAIERFGGGLMFHAELDIAGMIVLPFWGQK